MKNNETGEFELVVGNKQLLSGFFIVVLLFAVAFAMGYVVGQNTPQPTTQPAQGSQPAAGEKPAATPPTTGIVASSELPPGSYWQVIAVKPGGVEAMRQTLKDKGFQVALTPGTSNLTRVLVGPYNDTPSLGRAKTALETAGFQPVRYKRD